MKYIRLNENREVIEILPCSPSEEVTSAELLADCIKLRNNVKVEIGWIEQSDGSFSPPETIATIAPMKLDVDSETTPVVISEEPQEPVKTATLNMKVDGQKLSINGTAPHIVAGSVNYLRIQFEFSPEWDGLKFALFHDRWSNNPTKVKLEDDGCYIPSNEIKNPWFGVSVYCVTDDKRQITTDKKLISVAKGGGSYGIAPGPSPSMSNTIYSPVEGRIRQIRVINGVFEYTTDDKTWKTLGEII